jgi:hypothetical protein
MQKLTEISSGQNNKSCRIIHKGSNKIVSHFSDLSVIFYAIYKNQPLTFTIGVALLQGGPRKENFLRNVVPGSGGRRGVAQFRRGLAGARPGRVGERFRGHVHSVSGVGQGRGGAPTASSCARRS